MSVIFILCCSINSRENEEMDGTSDDEDGSNPVKRGPTSPFPAEAAEENPYLAVVTPEEERTTLFLAQHPKRLDGACQCPATEGDGVVTAGSHSRSTQAQIDSNSQVNATEPIECAIVCIFVTEKGGKTSIKSKDATRGETVQYASDWPNLQSIGEIRDDQMAAFEEPLTFCRKCAPQQPTINGVDVTSVVWCHLVLQHLMNRKILTGEDCEQGEKWLREVQRSASKREQERARSERCFLLRG